jgi:hypothetical protein
LPAERTLKTNNQPLKTAVKGIAIFWRGQLAHRFFRPWLVAFDNGAAVKPVVVDANCGADFRFRRVCRQCQIGATIGAACKEESALALLNFH